MSPLPIVPLTSPPDATIVVPGSKSIINRALVTAFLAEGTSVLGGFTPSDDTEAMLGVIASLGGLVEHDSVERSVRVTGLGGHGLAGVDALLGDGGGAEGGADRLDVRSSGTTARFAFPLAALGGKPRVVDGTDQMRARPMDTSVAALRSLGATAEGSHLPLTIAGPLRGGQVELPADVSSQFASGLLLSGPAMADGLDLTLTGRVVSQPYLDMTVAVMESFGAEVHVDGVHYVVPATSAYRPTDYVIEPDASAASYFFAAAALMEGAVVIGGLGSASLQGDVGFVRVLAEMGADVEIGTDYVRVTGTGTLGGVDVDMSDISDTAQTLAALAPFADGPTRVTGIGFIRKKETDRIAAVVTELNRLGIHAQEDSDGFTIQPGAPQPATVETYDDHRMAMSFALIGLRAPGIAIANPDCVNKTFPEFWTTLSNLRPHP